MAAKLVTVGEYVYLWDKFIPYTVEPNILIYALNEFKVTYHIIDIIIKFQGLVAR